MGQASPTEENTDLLQFQIPSPYQDEKIKEWLESHQCTPPPDSTIQHAFPANLHCEPDLQSKQSDNQHHTHKTYTINLRPVSKSRHSNKRAVSTETPSLDTELPVSLGKVNAKNPFKPGRNKHKTPSVSSLPDMALINAQSLGNKTEELEHFVRRYNIDIVAITETWVPSADFVEIDGYSFLLLPRCDADGTPVNHGGGVGFLCKSSIKSRILQIPVPRNRLLEVQWLWVRPKWLPKVFGCIVYGVVYYPPNGPFRKDLLSYLQNCTDWIRCKYPCAAIIIAGDFNDIKSPWVSETLSLKQIVSCPTRKEKTLDRIFTNCSDYFHEPRTQHPLGRGDHLIIRLEPNGHKPKNGYEIRRYRPITKEGIDNYRRWLSSTNWTELLRLEGANEMTEFLLDYLLAAFHQCFPEKQKKSKALDKPWMTDEIRRIINKRDKLFDEGYLNDALKLRNAVVNKCRAARRQYGAKVVEQLSKTDPKKFHTTVKKLLGRQCHSSEVLDHEGKPLSPDDINSYFAEICSRHPPLQHLPEFDGTLNDIPIITPLEVEKKISKMNQNKASCPFEVPTKIIAQCSKELSIPLAAVFNQCLVEGTFPTRFKVAYIVPIPKVSNPTQVKDLRPISKTSNFSKIYEDFLFSWLYDDIKESIDPRQFGFRPKHSTIHYLVIMMEEILRHLENPGSYVDVLIADMVKAFDLLDHNIVVSGAAEMKARQFLVRQMASFLSGRKQCVELKNKQTSVMSEFLSITCGAPQGTKLGPLAFLIAVNKLVLQLSQRLKFADDLTLPTFRLVSSDSQDLKLTLEELRRQASEAKLQISTEKSVVLRVNFTKSDPEPIESEADLKAVESAKILGIVIDNNLGWESQTSKLVQRGASLLKQFAQLRRFGLSQNTLTNLYKTYIRPALEYGCQVWHAGLTKAQDLKIERTQKRACRIILGHEYTSYEESLASLGLVTLSNRRHELLMAFGRSCLSSELFRSILPDFQPAAENKRPTRGSNSGNQKLKLPPANCSVRYDRSFVPYFCKNFNNSVT